MKHRRRTISYLMAIIAVIAASLGVPAAQATSDQGTRIMTVVIVKDLTPNGQVIDRHVYREPAVYLTGTNRTAKAADSGGRGTPSNSGRRSVTIRSWMLDTFGIRLWHQWVTIDWSWQYPQSVKVNSTGRGWSQDDHSVTWNGWINGVSRRFSWAGDLYPNSGWVKSAQGSWTVVCMSTTIHCYYYPWDKIWAHSDGTWYFYANYYDDNHPMP